MELVELGTILHMEKGKKPQQQVTEAKDGFLPYVDIKAFEQGIIDNYAFTEKCLLCEDGDLLIVCDGSRSGLTGRAIKGVVGSTLSKISADGVLTEYLRYFIQSKYTLLNTRKKGTGTPHLNADILKKSKLVVPSEDEQKRIVSRIEALFSQIDEGISTLNKIQSQIEVYKQAVYEEAFSGDWPIKDAEELCEFITKGTTPPKSMKNDNPMIPFIKVYNMTFDGTLDFSVDPTFVSKEIHEGFLARSVLYPGDVLMNIVGPPIGKVSIVPDTYHEWNMNQAIARFRCKDDIYNRYLAHFLMSGATVNKLNKMGKATAGQYNLTLEICRKIAIPLPSLEEQKSIVDMLEEKLTVCLDIAHTINKALAQAEAMKQSILKQAFEGRLI